MEVVALKRFRQVNDNFGAESPSRPLLIASTQQWLRHGVSKSLQMHASIAFGYLQSFAQITTPEAWYRCHRSLGTVLFTSRT